MNKKYILILILIVAAILRFYRLGEVPVSVDWDEAAIGYNAYSLIETGKDEYGQKFPLVFRSFDDYKPPLYFYLAIPAVKIFGVNEFSVRFPSAFFGTLTILFTFLLFEKLIKKFGNKKIYWLEFIPLTTAFLLAISPWHIHFSRVAFEANTGVFFNVLGVYLFLKGLEKGWWLVGSAAIFSLALYEYHSERVFVPLLVLALLILFWRELWQKKAEVLVSVVVGMLMVVPLVLLLLNPSNLTRLSGTSSFADQTPLLSRNIAKLQDAQERGDFLGKLFANRRVTYAQVLLNGYLSHFDANWLFIEGDQERHKAPGMGLLYWWELPFLLVGLYQLAASPHFSRKMKILLYTWFLISPVAAAPTTGVPHAIRTLVFLPTLQFFVALGLLNTWNYFRDKKLWVKNSLYILFFAFVLFNFVYYLNVYFVHLNKEFSKYWQYGYKEAVIYTQENYDNYDRIVVSPKLEQPHAFFLFFTKYPPKEYLANGGTYSGGFAEERNKFLKYEFRRFNVEEETLAGTTLYIGTPSEIPGDGIHHIDYLDGTRAIEFYEK